MAASGEACEGEEEARYQVGDRVMVRREDSKVRWRKPHIRTPGYLFGSVGVVERVLGTFPDPEHAAFQFGGNTTSPSQTLYLVTFTQEDLWAHSHSRDLVTAEIYQSWLQQVKEEDPGEESDNVVIVPSSNTEEVDHGDHVHDSRYDTELESIRREMTTDDPLGLRMAEILLKVLISREILDILEVNAVMEMMDNAGKMLGGQRLVVKAWTDPQFKERLLRDGNAAAAELGIIASNANAPTKFVVVENTETEHHLIVCTLCSCYPSAVMGMAPAWYKSRAYRARAIRQPREVLEEFGLRVPREVTVVVHDSTADCRYMVLPLRPAHTEGWSEEELQRIISRDSLIGVAVPTAESRRELSSC